MSSVPFKMVGPYFFILATSCFVGVFSADLSGCRPNKPKVINTFYNLKGDIYSPGFKEGSYPNDLFCEYTLMAPYGMRIKLNFNEFDIDPYDMCMKDMLAIHEGGDARGPVHGIFCGNETPNALLSLGNALHLVFRSDFLTGRKGFHITYEAAIAHAMCPAGKSICRNRNCFSIATRCNGKDECGDGTDEVKCNRPLPVTECGKTPIAPISNYADVERIVGGKPATPGSWPWQADLQVGYFYPNGHSCGATLINAQWLVSAAHCFQRMGQASAWRIHLGNYRKFEKDKYEQVRYAERIIVYPGYTGDQELKLGRLDMNNDIALVKLSAPVEFTDHVRPACIPTQGQQLAPRTKCIATGWGMTRGTGHNDVLKQVELTIQANCVSSTIPINNKTMICVTNEKGFQDVCHGDSGGPLVCKIQEKWYVMGATSFGSETSFESGMCALPGSRTIYTKISDKTSWINQMIERYS